MNDIYIHGLGQTPSDWGKTIAFMPGQESAGCPDLSRLISGRDATYQNLYEAFSEYCDNVSQNLNLCGLSLGAVLALNYAIDHPGKINSLVLIAGQYKMPKILLKFQDIIFRCMPEKAFPNTGFSKQEFISLTRSMLAINFTEKLKELSCPVLILCGEKDAANKKAAGKLAENIPGAKLLFVENAGHEINRDAPERLAGILKDFYDK